MSSRIGTLQAPRTGRSILIAAILAAIVVATVAVVAVSIGREAPTGAPAGITEVSTGNAETSAVSSGVNTPTELVGGIDGWPRRTVAANTPSELSGGFVQLADPRELTAAERFDLHQRI